MITVWHVQQLLEPQAHYWLGSDPYWDSYERRVLKHRVYDVYRERFERIKNNRRFEHDPENERKQYYSAWERLYYGSRYPWRTHDVPRRS